MHMGWGWGGYGVGPLKFAHQLRRRMPAFYQQDEYGVPDVVQRLHWDAERAQALGIPAPYDYGQMRAAWVSHLLTNWIGDDGWLAEMDLQLRGFNYHGDVHRCTGTVTSKGEGLKTQCRWTSSPPASGAKPPREAPPRCCCRRRRPVLLCCRSRMPICEGGEHRSFRGFLAKSVKKCDDCMESEITT